MVTLRVGLPGLVCVRRASFPDRDSVPDGDLPGAGEDVLDQQPQHPLAFFDGGGSGVAAQRGEEALQVVGELEVGITVSGLGVEGAGLAAQVLLAGAQVGHPGAQLIDGDQLFGEGLDHGGDRGGGLGGSGLEAFALAGDRVGGAGGFQALADLGPDQGRAGEQGGDVVPDDGVEVVGADRLVATDPPALVPVVVAAQAPVVVDLLVRGPGGGPVVGVPARRAGRQALEQGGDLSVAGGVTLVAGQPLGGSPERLGARVGGVAQHAPDHEAVPAGLAGSGGDVFAGEPAGQVGDGSAVVGVAAEQLGGDRRLMIHDLVAGSAVSGLAGVAVAERGSAQDVDRPAAGPVGLTAPVALHQLGFLIFGEHARELP